MLQSQGKLPPMTTKRKSEDAGVSTEASNDGHENRELDQTPKQKKKKKRKKEESSDDDQSESDYSD